MPTRLPKVKPVLISTAYEMYHNYSSFSHKLLMQLFDCSDNTACRIKKAVKEEMAQRGVKVYDRNNVCKKITFELYGLDIKQIDRDYRAIQKAG